MKKQHSQLHESEVLVPLPPALVNVQSENDWPEFTIIDAEVTDSKGRLISVLTASVHNLLHINGRLKLKSVPDHLLKAGLKTSKISSDVPYTVTEVGRYAYGYEEHGRIVIWAAGKAGWYIIQPSQAYKAIHRDMCEAVKLWYFTLDSNKTESPGPQRIFNKYAMTWQVKAVTVEQMFRKHAEFIFANMKADKESVKWARKPFFSYLKSVLESNISSTSSTIRTAPQTPIPLPTASDTKPKMSPTALQSTSSLKQQISPRLPLKLESPTSTLPIHPAVPRKRGRPRKIDSINAAPASLSTPTVTADLPRHARTSRVQSNNIQKEPPKVLDPIAMLQRQKDDAAALWKFLEKLTKTVPVRNASIDIFASQLYASFQLTDVLQAQDYILYQAENLLKYMHERRRNKDWIKAPLYKQLLEADITTSLKGRMAKILLDTRDYALIVELNTEGLEYASSSDEETTPRQAKSVLRPVSAKGSAKRSKSYKGNEVSRGKRKAEFDEESETSTRSKRRTVSLDMSERSSVREDSPASAGALPRAEINWGNGNSTSEVPVMISSEPVLEAEPNGPGDVWRCPSFGCMEVIYGASGDLGKVLIEEHIEQHEDDEGEQEDVVMREMKKTNLPVSNLIKRIREFAAAKELGDAVSLDELDNSRTMTPITRLGVV